MRKYSANSCWIASTKRSNVEDVFLEGKALVDAAGLDYVILYEFYFLRKEDGEIFEDHIAKFASETGRQRSLRSLLAP